MNITVMALIVALAFVIGMITTTGLASAHLDVCAQPSVNSKKSVWHALCDLQQQIDSIELLPGPPGESGIADVGLVEFLDVNLVLGENDILFSCPSSEQIALAYGSEFDILSATPQEDNGWNLGFICPLGDGCTTTVWLKCLSTTP